MEAFYKTTKLAFRSTTSSGSSQALSSVDEKAITARPMVLFEKFTCFRKLPLELRLVVWELSIPGPRRVDLDIRRFEDNREKGNQGLGILGACRESRSLVLKKTKYVDVCAPYNVWYLQRRMAPKWAGQWFDLEQDVGVVHLRTLIEANNNIGTSGREFKKFLWSPIGQHITDNMKRLVIRGSHRDWEEAIRFRRGGLLHTMILRSAAGLTEKVVFEICRESKGQDLGDADNWLYVNSGIFFYGVRESLGKRMLKWKVSIVN